MAKKAEEQHEEFMLSKTEIMHQLHQALPEQKRVTADTQAVVTVGLAIVEALVDIRDALLFIITAGGTPDASAEG